MTEAPVQVEDVFLSMAGAESLAKSRERKADASLFS